MREYLSCDSSITCMDRVEVGDTSPARLKEVELLYSLARDVPFFKHRPAALWC
jgi:hypothetical protein